jgi:glycosyltransferase involved in cell wall biosynthesis
MTLLTGLPAGERVIERLDRRDRIRVAAVMDTQIVSGPGRQLAALVPAMREAGVDTRIIVFQNPAREVTPYRRFLEAAGVDHVVVPFRSRFDRALLPAFRAALDAWDPDIVQTHSYRPTTLTWLLQRQGVRWRWIGFFHGTTNEDLKVRLYHWLDRRLLPAADRVVVMSRSQVSRFAACGNRVVQVYNAVVPVPPVAVPVQTQRVFDHVGTLTRPRIGVVGRLSAEKGVDVMVEALAGIRAREAGASLVLAGDGPERAALESQATRLGLRDAVHFLGPVLPIEPLYPLLDVLVIPSRSEGLPNVLLEALRADLPVVSTRVGAVPEVLDGSRAGRTVPPGDAKALAEAVTATLSEPVEAAREDRSAVVGRFSLDQRVGAHVQLYRDVLAGALRC